MSLGRRIAVSAISAFAVVAASLGPGLATSASASDGLPWGTPEAFTPTGAQTGQLVMSADGSTLMAASRVYDSGSGNQRPYVTVNTGTGWSAPIPVFTDPDPSVSSFNVVLSADGQKAAAVYRDCDGTCSLVTATSTSPFVSWSLTTIGSAIDGADIAISASSDLQTIAIIWAEFGGSVTVSSTITSDGGQTWETPTQLASMSDIWRWQIAVSADGSTITAVWLKCEQPLMSATTTSKSWAGYDPNDPADAVPVAASARCKNNPSVALSQDGGRIVIVWEESNDADDKRNITSAYSTTQGASWTESMLFDAPDGTYSGSADLGLSDDGLKATVIWDNDDALYAATTTDGAVTWSGETKISSEGLELLDEDRPQVVTSADGSISSAVWQLNDGNTSVAEVSTTQDSGATWSTPERFGDPSSEVPEVEIAASSSGTTAAVMWRDYNADRFNGSIAESTPPPAPAPTVSSVSPAKGSKRGGTNVTITGTGFVDGATVTFGGKAATNVQVVNETTITARTPSGAVGLVAVQVTNSDGQVGSMASAFRYVAAAKPVIKTKTLKRKQRKARDVIKARIVTKNIPVGARLKVHVKVTGKNWRTSKKRVKVRANHRATFTRKLAPSKTIRMYVVYKSPTMTKAVKSKTVKSRPKR